MKFLVKTPTLRYAAQGELRNCTIWHCVESICLSTESILQTLGHSEQHESKSSIGEFTYILSATKILLPEINHALCGKAQSRFL
jgi:hypothetical protein